MTMLYVMNNILRVILIGLIFLVIMGFIGISLCIIIILIRNNGNDIRDENYEHEMEEQAAYLREYDERHIKHK